MNALPETIDSTATGASYEWATSIDTEEEVVEWTSPDNYFHMAEGSWIETGWIQMSDMILDSGVAVEEHPSSNVKSAMPDREVGSTTTRPGPLVDRPWYETPGVEGMRLAIQRSKRLAREEFPGVGFGAPTVVQVPPDEDQNGPGESMLLVEVRVFLPEGVDVEDFLMPYLTLLSDELSEADIQRLAIRVVPSTSAN